MAMTRTEIEILIKARNDASQSFQALGADVAKLVASSDRAATAMETLATKTDKAKPAADGANVAFGILASTVATKLVSAFQSSIASANRLDGAMIGLGSTARAFGADSDAATKAAQSLASDGLLSVSEAAAGLKNLLASGFNLDQATTLMLRFKDAAAFGKQGSLEFGQAIVGATEGVKNGNSALVDNAGVTKNLSNILVEAGKSATDLSKVQSDLSVRTALYNGLLKETNPQLGDAARYLDTAAGKQAKFSAEIESASQQIGKGLQPVLATLMTTISPLIQMVGQNADVVVRLGTVVAAVVAPLALMKATAALGIPSFSGLGAAIKLAGTEMTLGTTSAASFRLGLNSLATQAGLTTASLGVLGTAVAVAGAAFAGWQVGRFVAELTGADKAIGDFVGRNAIWTESMHRAGNVLDTVNKAVKAGAAANISFTDAIKYNTAVDTIRLAQFNKSADARERGIKAELELGRITKEEANERLALVAAENSGIEVRNRMITAGAAVEAAERSFQNEIKATTFTAKELAANLKANETSFMIWAKAIGLSEPTIKRLKDGLQESEKAHKAHEAAQKKVETATKAMQDALSALGIVTLPVVNQKLTEMDAQVKAATAAGVPFNTIVRAIWPELERLAEAAKLSGVGLQVVKDKMKSFEGQGFLLQPTKSIVTFAETMPVVTQEFAPLMQASRASAAEQTRLNAAFEAFGLKTPAQTRAAADAAIANFKRLKESGTATPAQIAIAHEQMVKVIRDQTGQIPSIWAGMIPKVLGSIETLSTAINGTFAQMLIGAKGFKDGFVDIWESIKKSVLNILNSILSTFLNAFIKGITGALMGQSGAWSNAFRGIAGAANGGGVNWGQMLGVGGQVAGAGGGAAGMAGGALLPASGFVGYAGTAGGAAGATGATAGTGAAAGGIGMGTALGIAGGAAAGGIVGWKVGRATGSVAKGALSGAAAGAAVGAFGGPIGMGVGAGVGALAGWLGARKANKDADKEMNAIREKLMATFGDMENLKEAAAAVGVNIERAFGVKGKKGVEEFNKIVGEFEEKFNALDGAAKRYGVTMDELGAEKSGKKMVDEFTLAVEQMGKDYTVLTANGLTTETTLKKMAPAFNSLVMAALDGGKKLPDSMRPMLEKMLELGLITEDVKNKLAGLATGTTVDFQAMQQKAQAYGIDLASLGPQFQQARLSESAQVILADFDMLTKSGADVGGVLFGMKEEISQLVTESLKFGTAIPENMRPLIDELDKSGLLLDENGDKIAGLGDLKFAAPLVAGFAEVVQAIKDLTTALTGDLPAAAEEGIARADGVFSRWRPQMPPLKFEGPEDFDPPAPSAPTGDGYPGAAHGVLHKGRNGGDLLLFGEGGEAEMGGPVAFMQRALEGAMAKVGGPGSGGITVRVPVMLDRRQMGEAIFELTPEILRQKGVLH